VRTILTAPSRNNLTYLLTYLTRFNNNNTNITSVRSAECPTKNGGLTASIVSRFVTFNTNSLHQAQAQYVHSRRVDCIGYESTCVLRSALATGVLCHYFKRQ